jgi:hypothetical protein
MTRKWLDCGAVTVFIEHRFESLKSSFGIGKIGERHEFRQNRAISDRIGPFLGLTVPLAAVICPAAAAASPARCGIGDTL